jgi:sigma-B regulation protein RsbU (phosphoserine phosphatase)
MNSFIHTLLSLINSVAVIVVIAYFLTRSLLFKRVLEKKMTVKDQLLLILLFGLFSIYGTLGGIHILGGIANIRDLGPTIAGLMAGPIVGLGAGIVGGIHRYFQGGFTALACGIAPIVAGLAGGTLYVINRGRFPGMVPAVILMIVVELLHMGIALALSHPREQALQLVQSIIIQMIFANSIGIGIYAYIMENLLKERSLEKARLMMEGELRVAREIQMSLVPKTFPPVPIREEFSLFATLEPAKEVGGDLYDFYFTGEDRLFFMIGDVSGKGIPAALFMAVTRTIMKAKMNPDMRPGLVISEVNQELCEGNDATMFVTAFCGFLDLCTGDITYINAGHNPPAFVKADGSVSLVKIITDPPLGIREEMRYSEGILHLEPGDTLVLYTDGVTEAVNSEDAFFSEDKLLNILQGTAEMPVQEVIDRVRETVHLFSAGNEPADDITLLALRLNFINAGKYAQGE